MPKPLTQQQAMHLAAQLVTEHTWLSGEVRRLFHQNHIMRDALQELAEYTSDCNHDVIARRALAEQK